MTPPEKSREERRVRRERKIEALGTSSQTQRSVSEPRDVAASERAITEGMVERGRDALELGVAGQIVKGRAEADFGELARAVIEAALGSFDGGKAPDDASPTGVLSEGSSVDADPSGVLPGVSEVRDSGPYARLERLEAAAREVVEAWNDPLMVTDDVPVVMTPKVDRLRRVLSEGQR